MALFKHEAGGHRHQRVPPTETKGRRHSSTFTVAVFGQQDSSGQFSVDDVTFEATVGHGPGGQHRNKTASAIRAVHRPTGITAYIQSERSQHANKAKAIEVIKARVLEAVQGQSHTKQNAARQDQIGSGERSDKIRTVQEQNDRVIDHRTGKTCSVAAYRKGEIWRLHPKTK
jgi:peptide chain release factor 1